MVGNLLDAAQFWAILHLSLGRAMLSVVGGVACKSYSRASVAWIKTKTTVSPLEC